jgi:integrase
MAWEERTNSKHWRGAYRDPDGKIRRKTFKTKTAAKQWAEEQEATIRHHTYIDPRSGDVVFKDLVEVWLDSYVGSPQRVDHVTRILRLHVLPTFEDMPLRSITTMAVQAWVKRLTKGAAPSSVRQYYSVFTAILNAAVHEGMLAKNPAARVKLPDARKEERVFLNHGDADTLVAVIPDRYRALVTTALWTGARWGELAGLRVENVNFLRRQIHIDESLIELNGNFTVGPPKTKGSRRIIGIHQNLVDVLAQHLAAYPPRSGLVFTTLSGTHISRANFRQRVWLPAIKRAGLEKQPHFHDLRHTHVAWLIHLGWPMKAISQRLGHTTIGMTFDTYGHLLDETTDALVASLTFEQGAKQGATTLLNRSPSSPIVPLRTAAELGR